MTKAEMSTEEIIDRAIKEGCTAEQIIRVVELLIEQNAFRSAHGFPMIGLEDVMPRYI